MSNRRDFLKIAGLTGLGIGLSNITACVSGKKETESVMDDIRRSVEKKHSRRFNMCGYAAPKIDTLRIAYIGIGARGKYALERIIHFEGVDVKAVCEIRQSYMDDAKKILDGFFTPDYYSGEEDWKRVCDRDDIDLVYISTHWETHTPMSVYAMEHGKHVAVELPAAVSVDECWQLVETSERTRKHCMMLENVCYGFFELLTLNMARQGFFGDIIHCEGGYLHNGFNSLFQEGHHYDYWRLKENRKTGNLYPTHGMGHMAQVLGINRGDKMNYMSSLSSADFSFPQKIKEMSEKNSDFVPFLKDIDKFRGNINTSIIRTEKGRSMMLQHDYTTPRPYSRIDIISGTKAYAQQYPEPGKIAVGEEWVSDEKMKELQEQYNPEIVKRFGKIALEVDGMGHGGMDMLMDWRLIDCLRNGLPLDQDVYDAAAWSVIRPLSIWSAANKSQSIDIPDFTCGQWKTNREFDLSLSEGGTTGIK